MEGKYYESIYDQVVNLHIDWKTYRNIFAVSEEQFNFVKKIDENFFRVCENAIWDSTLMRIARLLDPPSSCGKDNISISFLYNDIEKELNDSNKFEIDDILTRLNQHKEKIKTLRDKRIAHADKEWTINSEKYYDKELSRQEVENILSDIREFLRIISSLYSNVVTDISAINSSYGGLGCHVGGRKLLSTLKLSTEKIN